MSLVRAEAGIASHTTMESNRSWVTTPSILPDSPASGLKTFVSSLPLFSIVVSVGARTVHPHTSPAGSAIRPTGPLAELPPR